VGTLHRVTRAALETAAPIHPSARYLQLHRPAFHVFVDSSAATNQLVRLVQASEELAASLDRLDREWRPDALIHADLRLDNFLVSNAQTDRPRLTIVDWETAGTGDSCWDVGTFFAGHLYGWLLSAPVTRDGSPGAFMELARLSLPAMRPAMRRFWRAYLRARAIPVANRDEFLLRGMRYAGARLVQHAFEEAQRMTRLNALAIYLLQVGLNVMQRPADAAARLLGLPVPLAVLA
jgi:aminoglycoside phosphotransferase (APT) family kinase protein